MFGVKSLLSLRKQCPKCAVLQQGNVFRRYKTGWSQKKPVTVIATVNGKEIVITVGKLAKLANGSAIAKTGDTSVLATVVSEQSSGSSFQSGGAPITVNYQNKAAAAGRIPLNFLRRELGQSQDEVLRSRMIDRSLRPLFSKEFNNESQVLCTLMSYDRINQPEPLAINAASAALTVSSLPWRGPIGSVRVGYRYSQPIINPTQSELAKSSLNLVLAADKQGKIVMLDGEANNITLKQLSNSITEGAEAAGQIANQISQLEQYKTTPLARTRSMEDVELLHNQRNDVKTVQDWLHSHLTPLIKAVYMDSSHDKFSRDNQLDAIRLRALSHFKTAELTISREVVESEFLQLTNLIVRDLVLNTEKRVDGRSLTQIRPISCEIDLYPSLHGSALFQRGQTQVLSTITLDRLASMKKADPVSEILVGRSSTNFMLHYQFPQYATGALSKTSGINRRELGHGALAEKAVRPVIPEDFPFTIRSSCEVLESSGSSSMASVCATSLALLDAGVTISSPVAGVAMGLMSESNKDGDIERFRILTDIMGLEDAVGDMDFKVAGTKFGFTALQLDVKVPGLLPDIINEALLQAAARINTLVAIMGNTINSPRAEGKSSWPVMAKAQIPQSIRPKFIGIGGRNIKDIERETGVHIEMEDHNEIVIFAPTAALLEKAKIIITEMLTVLTPIEFEFGNVYSGKVCELTQAGIKVTVHPGMDPIFVSNSQLDLAQIHHSSASGLQVGDEIQIKYFGNDPNTGSQRWSRKALLTTSGIIKNPNKTDSPEITFVEEKNGC